METEKKKQNTRPKANPPSAWEQALRWLDAKWYSEARLQTRLQEKGYPAAEIAHVMNDLRRYQLVNDAELAAEFAKSESLRGRGSRRIRMELARHGLSGTAAQQALAAIAPGEEEAARTALSGKLRSWAHEPDVRKRRDKAFRFLAGRGFGVDVVRRAMDTEPSLQYGYEDGPVDAEGTEFEASLGADWAENAPPDEE